MNSDQLSRKSVLILQQRIILTMGSLPQIGNNSGGVFYRENYERMGKMLRLIKINDPCRAVYVRIIEVSHIFYAMLKPLNIFLIARPHLI